MFGQLMAATSIMDLAPFVPAEQALRKSALPDKAMALNRISAKLAGRLAPEGTGYPGTMATA
jgi:hypothetical protein